MEPNKKEQRKHTDRKLWERENKTKERPKYNMWQNCGYMISMAVKEQEKKILVICVLKALTATAGSLTDLYITPAALNVLETGGGPVKLITTILFFGVLATLIAAASGYLDANDMFPKIKLRTALIAQIQVKKSVTSYPNLFDETFRRKADKANMALNSNAASGEAVWETLTALMRNIMGFVLYLVLMSAVHPLFIVVILATALASYFVNKSLSKYGYRHRQEEEACNSRRWTVSRDYAEDMRMAKDIRLFGMRPWLEEIYDKATDAYKAFLRRGENVYIWGRILDLVLTFLRNGLVYACLIFLVLDGGLSVSAFLLYFTAAGGFSGWVTSILDNLLTLHRQSLDLSTYREVLEYPELFAFEEGRGLEPKPEGRYEIQLEDVSFRYPGAEEDTLSHISLTLHPGEKLALVGLNGAGKTTLVKILCGFLDPTKGRVLLDGEDIRVYNRRDYYRMFSAVFQDFMVLAVSVAANVAQTEDTIDTERMKACIDEAGLREKVESLPDGYDTKLNREVYEDAVMLSGGETQRLMLARALYKDAPFVVLDEPTAALDPIAESDLYNKYSDMTKGRSSVYISHRLASTRFCDRILLIEGGRIAEEGTHEELLAAGGRYAELFEVQSKYYREDREDVTDGEES